MSVVGIFSKLFVIFMVSGMVLTGCGGSGGDSSGSSSSPSPSPPSFTEKNFEFEKPLRAIFIDGHEEHLFELETTESVVLNIEVTSYVYGIYDIGFSTRSPDFYLYDNNFDIIGFMSGGTGSYSSTTTPVAVNENFELENPGTYYIVAGFASASQLDGSFPLRSISSGTEQNDYIMTVVKQYNTNEIYGTDGNDILRGYDADQYIYGFSGNDVIYGGDGNDTIDGGDGNDIIHGGKGADRLIGGAGQDIFVYVNFDESGPNVLQRDTIEDFTPGEDFIDLSKMIYKHGNQTYRFTGSSIFNEEPTRGSSDILWFVDGVLYGKLNPNKGFAPNAPDFSIALPGVVELSRNDFIFN